MAGKTYAVDLDVNDAAVADTACGACRHAEAPAPRVANDRQAAAMEKPKGGPRHHLNLVHVVRLAKRDDPPQAERVGVHPRPGPEDGLRAHPKRYLHFRCLVWVGSRRDLWLLGRP